MQTGSKSILKFHDNEKLSDIIQSCTTEILVILDNASCVHIIWSSHMVWFPRQDCYMYMNQQAILGAPKIIAWSSQKLNNKPPNTDDIAMLGLK